jgi:precorrin-3B synthase
MRALALASRQLGDGSLELTSRGNVQLRGLGGDVADELGARLFEAGLWPSQTHELARNVVASPLGRLDDVVRAFDRALCAESRLAELSGRFLFGFDDGSGDIAALRPDVLAVHDWVEGRRVSQVTSDVRSDVVAAMLAAAHAFLDERAAQGSTAWRVKELDDGPARIRARLARLHAGSNAGSLGSPIEPAPVGAAPPAPAGIVDGHQVLLVPLGRLTAVQAEWLAAALGDGVAHVTPWRSIVLPTLVEGGAEAGFGVDETSRWYGVSACAGQPGCAKALADVQSEAARTAGQWRNVHFSGCARRCGRPVDTVVDVLATEDGYVISNA